jgi:predicted MPP superfamily phosphohydrolase
MINATRTLGQMKTKYGIYYISGNHDKGYYGAAHRGFSEDDLFNELKKNGINILQDESILVDNLFYVIGRRDYSVQHEQGGHRKSIEELTKDLDKSKYMIVLDHQPVEYDKEADAKVDLVLSGHTHGGQLFPFNKIGKWIKANDLVYGYEKRQDTDFIVTSGISDWAIKFKTGTKSEFVIINIRKGK